MLPTLKLKDTGLVTSQPNILALQQLKMASGGSQQGNAGKYRYTTVTTVPALGLGLKRGIQEERKTNNPQRGSVVAWAWQYSLKLLAHHSILNSSGDSRLHVRFPNQQKCRLLCKADVARPNNLDYSTDYEQLIRAFLNTAPAFKPAAKEQRQTRQNAYSQAF